MRLASSAELFRPWANRAWKACCTVKGRLNTKSMCVKGCVASKTCSGMVGRIRSRGVPISEEDLGRTRRRSRLIRDSWMSLVACWSVLTPVRMGWALTECGILLQATSPPSPCLQGSVMQSSSPAPGHSGENDGQPMASMHTVQRHTFTTMSNS